MEEAIHVVIMGCGRVGSTLAHSLEKLGHSVSIIDQDAGAFRRLGPEFSGKTVTGIGFDRDRMIEAGTETADAFVAVSSGDNSNIISARVAREVFGVRRVVARIYDPRRADVYQRLGIPTVATVRWTADQILHSLLPEDLHPEWSDPTSEVVLAALPYDATWVGHSLSQLEEATGERVAFVSRLGHPVLPQPGVVIQDGDRVHVLTTRARLVAAAKSCSKRVED